ncbi:MAG: ABC transporter ATP-binding protein, partial [Clostridia bacterium]|nr:ABC transporter ATP-binding protein [Clostridia bacterium]
AVAIALQSKNVIDSATAGSFGELKNSVIILAVIILLQFLLSFTYMKVNADIVAKQSLGMQRKIFESVVKMNYKHSTDFHTGELMNRITADADTVLCGIIGIVPSVVAFVTGIVAAFGALVIIQPQFALVCVVVGLVVGGGAIIWGRRLKRFTLECRKWSDKSNSFLMECLQNILVIKSFGNEKKVVEHAKSIHINSYRALKKRNNNSIMASLASGFAFTTGYFLALIWGAFGMVAGTVTYGNLIAMIQLVGKIQSPFKGIASVIPQYYQMIASAERLMDIAGCEENFPYNNIKGFDCIEFKDVSFGYNENEYVLENIDLKIDKGDFVLIAGMSGIGKSTLLKLMLSMYSPSEGCITVTDDEGVVHQLSPSIRNIFSYVPQGNMILSGTIRENVIFFDECIDDEKITECLKIAELWDDISQLPDGYNTVLGENGVGLSEGQVQRLAVARALYHNVPVILLDEATSALDETTEAKMLENIRNLKDKTCILISHKKVAERYMDKKIFIENGRVICC